MSEKRFIVFSNNVVWDNQLGEVVCRCILEGIGDAENVCQRLNEQQDTIEKQKRIIKSQDAEISRQYNLCLAMSGILREEFGVYDVFDRTKDKNIKKEELL